ncbi:hypothetical protein AQUCO_04500147v1 [Aquilegia coerulea]|uniref:protein-serine/threonine phosphatase n=1 Tax=Aquilegia coerulea TaxID=218851 RepID=A0A2G5CM34_AQUCA|nr:hypothetical protein AQUCO_04500147v1 [Aquilegia coerulea]
MSCAVAIANSPVFSPSRVSLFCKTNSPETLSFNHNNHGSSSSPSCSSSPCSPYRLRLQKSPIGLRSFKKESVVVVSNSGLNNSSVDSNGSVVLKRKRPIMRIDIPVVASLSFSDIPVSEQSELQVEREGYSVYCKRGRRVAMEDRFSAVDNLHGDSKQAFFGVFDGHGGAKAAEFASEHLHKNIMKEITRRVDTVEAIKQGYLTTDSEFLKEDVRGGTCCVTALISKGDLLISNAGDCRAILSRGGVAEALTSDHRPSREDERERIETKVLLHLHIFIRSSF